MNSPHAAPIARLQLNDVRLFRFKDEAEAIRLGNDTEFGLAAYFYGCGIGRVWRVVAAPC